MLPRSPRKRPAESSMGIPTPPSEATKAAKIIATEEQKPAAEEAQAHAGATRVLFPSTETSGWLTPQLVTYQARQQEKLRNLRVIAPLKVVCKGETQWVPTGYLREVDKYDREFNPFDAAFAAELEALSLGSPDSTPRATPAPAVPSPSGSLTPK